jgi:hypothetical protein
MKTAPVSIVACTLIDLYHPAVMIGLKKPEGFAAQRASHRGTPERTKTKDILLGGLPVVATPRFKKGFVSFFYYYLVGYLW